MQVPTPRGQVSSTPALRRLAQGTPFLSFSPSPARCVADCGAPGRGNNERLREHSRCHVGPALRLFWTSSTWIGKSLVKAETGGPRLGDWQAFRAHSLAWLVRRAFRGRQALETLPPRRSLVLCNGRPRRDRRRRRPLPSGGASEDGKACRVPRTCVCMYVHVSAAIIVHHRDAWPAARVDVTLDSRSSFRPSVGEAEVALESGVTFREAHSRRPFFAARGQKEVRTLGITCCTPPLGRLARDQVADAPRAVSWAGALWVRR